MKEISGKNFGLLIAYLLPGFTALWGLRYFSETIHLWLTGPSPDGPTIGGFLYVTLAAVAAGLTVSAIRWATIDTLHHSTGIPRPRWNFARLQQHFDAYDRLEHNHYAYYKAYANMLVAIFSLLIARFIRLGVQGLGWLDVAVLLCSVVFYAASRDTLRKYYTRVEQLLGQHL